LNQPEVLFAAAHAGFPDDTPLGGGKAVADFLIREWPGLLTVLSPNRFGMPGRTRRSASLHEMSEWQYARFCRQFERATTGEIIRHDPQQCVVLCNDISEGPDFSALGARGYRIVSIWHVDVVEFFMKFYLHGVVRPETAARLHRWPLPNLLRLVFRKQHDCVRHSARIVVPSAPMKEMILRCYPWCRAEKIIVLPWGDISARPAVAPYPAADSEFIIMTLSRLSPEKGIERFLTALGQSDTLKLRVWICGAPAYMRGRRYEKRLRRMADARVEFVGHVTGAEKAARLRRADLFVSPSRHESYGLTIAEAQAAGCRIISHAHYGAAGTVVDCADVCALAAAIHDVVRAGRIRKPEAPPTLKSDAAQRLLGLVSEIYSSGRATTV
jgi:glycosyltransferase involved in cell wall biosynthesis